MKTDSIIKSTIILTTAGLITKVIGFIYRVYMANELGAEAMGLYQLIIPLYILAWSISCSGITTTISKLTSESLSRRNYGEMKRFLYICLGMSFILSTTISVLLFLFADFLGNSFYNDIRVITPIKILTFSFPFMALGSCVRGYFYGLQKSTIPATSQVVEQLIKIFVIITLVTRFGSFTITYAVLGLVFSEIFAFFYVLYEFNKNKIDSFNAVSSISFKNSFNIIVAMALPLTLNKVLTSALVTYENMLIPLKLIEYGLPKEHALATLGQLTGMALPLIYFPSSLLVAISISLVPALASAKAKNLTRTIDDNINKTLLFTSFSSFWVLAFFITFPKHLSFLIYTDDISMYLLYLGFLAPFLYFQMVLNGILSGLGEHFPLFIHNILGSILTIISIYILVPKIGLTGFLVGFGCSLIFTSYSNYHKIKKYMINNITIFNLIFKPFLSAMCSFLTVSYFIKTTSLFGAISIPSLLIGVSTLSSIYIFFSIGTGFITIEDIKKVFSYIKRPIIGLSKNIFS